MSTLSIVFITCNRPQELIRAIRSCKVNELSDVEIIIWDNGSTDENRQILFNFIKQCSYEVKYHFSYQNLGVAGGRNAAWALSTGKYVFFMDDDAVIETKSFFQILVDYMDKNTNVGALGIDIFEPETNCKLCCKQTCFNGLSQKMILCYIGAAHILRKGIYPQKKLYPEKLMYGSEELFASLLIWNLGYEIHELQTVRVLHLPSKINRCCGKERVLNLIVNQYIIKRLTYPVLLHGVIYFMLRLRLIKHQLSWKSCANLLQQRYSKDESYRISFAVIFRLISRFGLFPLV